MLTYLIAAVAIAGIAAVLLIAKWIETRYTMNAILNEPRTDEVEYLTTEAERRIGKVS